MVWKVVTSTSRRLYIKYEGTVYECSPGSVNYAVAKTITPDSITYTNYPFEQLHPELQHLIYVYG